MKALWSQEEDRKLITFVEKFGAGKWTIIADELNGKTGKQCRERWNNQLKSNLKKGNWSDEEERILVTAFAEFGTRWSEIAKLIPNRSENTIKNHWYSTKRRKNPKLQATVLEEYIKTLKSTSASTSTNLTIAPPGPQNTGASASQSSERNVNYSAALICESCDEDMLQLKL